MEEERKIEKWLRAYAKKRRGQTKDAFDLHPATRRLLQDEIARRVPGPDQDDSVSLWEMLRQQWAWLLVFTACILLITTIFMPVVYKAKQKGQNTMGMANGMQSNQDLSQAVAMNNLARQPELPSAMQREPANAGGAGGAPPAPVPQPATSLALPPPPPPSVAASAPEPNSISQLPPALAAGTLSAAPEEPPRPTSASSDLVVNSASAPAETPATREAFESTVTETAARPQFRPAENAFRNGAAPSQNLPVLLNFQVQQNGKALRIVDQDGSVYVGSWRLANQSVHNGIVEERALQNSATQAAAKTPQTSAPPAVALADNLQAAQNYLFRVRGMNRTLRQNVIFTGSLLANYALSGNMQQTFGGMVANANGNEQQLKMDLTNQNAQLPWSNLRIAGTAVINRTNRIEVNAAPVTPVRQN